MNLKFLVLVHDLLLDQEANEVDVFFLRASRWYSLFFVLYVLLGVYFVTSLILAVVYDSFKGQVCIVYFIYYATVETVK